MMLISCAAVSTIGRIEWEPYIPTIFTRILRSIDLPVSYKGLKSSRNPQLYTGAIASKWNILNIMTLLLLKYEKSGASNIVSECVALSD